MIDKPIVKLPALGQAWLGDWRARIASRLARRGFSRVADFADTMPRAGLLKLAEVLGTYSDDNINRSDVAAEQVAAVWLEEATSEGSASVERMARRVLVGELYDELPGGWRRDWTGTPEAEAAAFRAASATTSWSEALGPIHAAAAERVFRALREAGGTLPDGWLPTDADDPTLVTIFRNAWAEG